MVIWLTGLSGAGKTSIGRALTAKLKARGVFALMLDGDEVRQAIADPHTGHGRADRLRNAYRICRLARLLESQGAVVVVATMSLFHEIHDWNRARFDAYFEVWVQADMGVLRRRDGKGLYAKVDSGEARCLPGVDLDYESPRNPDLTLENNAPLVHFDAPAERILARLDNTPAGGAGAELRQGGRGGD